jgi:hypothetical protein
MRKPGSHCANKRSPFATLRSARRCMQTRRFARPPAIFMAKQPPKKLKREPASPPPGAASESVVQPTATTPLFPEPPLSPQSRRRTGMIRMVLLEFCSVMESFGITDRNFLSPLYSRASLRQAPQHRPTDDPPTHRTGRWAMAAAHRRDVRPRRADRPQRLRFALGR